MNRLEDQLASAAEEARRQVAHIQTRPATAVRTRMYRHRALAGAAVAVGVFGLLGATALVANTNLTTDMAAAPESTAAATTTVAPPIETAESTPPPASAAPNGMPGDITDLIASIEASSELPGFEATNLIDGDPTTAWNDAGLRGYGATITLLFDRPVAISDLVIQGVGDTDRFILNYKVQGYEITVDDKPGVIQGRLVNSMEPQHIATDSAGTTVLTLSVTTTYLAEPVGDKPPFRELAIGEIQVIGAAVGDTAPEVAISPTTTIVAAESIAPSTPVDLPFDPRGDADWAWDWVGQVTSIEAGESTWHNDLNGIRQKLTHIQETVPEIGAANGLMFRSTEWYEDAFFLLGDGSDTMVYIGWNELESTDPVSADAWQEISSSGIDPVGIVLPQIDPSMGQGLTDDVLVLMRMTDRAADFVADTATVVATVRFFQLADSYAALPIQRTSDEMGRIADAIFAAMNLPKGEPGDLAPPINVVVPPVDMATLVTGVAQGEELPTVVVCAPDHPPVSSSSGDGVVYDSPIAALAGFLDGARSGADYLPLPRSGYTELHLPDGSIAFVDTFEPDPPLAVAWISIAESPAGWVVDEWKSAGC